MRAICIIRRFGVMHRILSPAVAWLLRISWQFRIVALRSPGAMG